MRRSLKFTVGLFSKLPEGEYSSRRRVGLSTSILAPPVRMTADCCARPLAMSIGVERFTGKLSAGDEADDAVVVATVRAIATATANPATGMAPRRRLTCPTGKEPATDSTR